MSAALDPRLLQRLRGSKLRIRRADASTGVGERRTRAIGPGIEFAEYREYVPGDDVRHVDRHVLGRHGRIVVRRFHLDRQLRTTVLLDCSGSMRVEDGDKFDRARALASAAAAIGVFGGDQVRFGAMKGERIEWHPVLRNTRALSRALAWVDDLRADGNVDLNVITNVALQQLAPGELLIVVSDWMLDGIEEAMRRLSTLRVEIVAVQVLTPQERSATQLAQGPLRLVDAETGAVLEIALDAEGLLRYDEAFAAWQDEIRESITRHGGRWLPTSSHVDLEEVLFRSWRRQGFVA